jgi:hypothetical protein
VTRPGGLGGAAGEGGRDTEGGRGGEGGDDRIEAAVEHLQTAARELIAAARVFLDVTEDLVNDPKQVLAAIATLTDLGRSVISTSHPADGREEQEGEGRRAPRVQHIRIS